MKSNTAYNIPIRNGVGLTSINSKEDLRPSHIRCADLGERHLEKEAHHFTNTVGSDDTLASARGFQISQVGRKRGGHRMVDG